LEALVENLSKTLNTHTVNSIGHSFKFEIQTGRSGPRPCLASSLRDGHLRSRF
jgi:hypothetical protein